MNKQVLISESYCNTKELFMAGNGQSIRNFLLQSASKYCTNYVTDIIIWIDRAARVLYEDNQMFTDCGFRDNGISWEGENFNDVFKMYRLERNIENDTLILYDITQPIMNNNIKKYITNLRMITENNENISEYDKRRLLSNIEALENYSL